MTPAKIQGASSPNSGDSGGPGVPGRANHRSIKIAYPGHLTNRGPSPIRAKTYGSVLCGMLTSRMGPHHCARCAWLAGELSLVGA